MSDVGDTSSIRTPVTYVPTDCHWKSLREDRNPSMEGVPTTFLGLDKGTEFDEAIPKRSHRLGELETHWLSAHV